jgi:hypothetical protein
MNDRTDQEALEAVLEAYVASADDPNHASLVEWIRRYPHYERELTEVAVAWSQMERLPPAPRARELETDILVLRGMSIFQNVRHRQMAERGEEQSIDGIVATASQRGLSIDKLADLLELTVALVRKVDLRRFAYVRLPNQLKDAVASVLDCTRAVVERYLQGPPRFARGVRHKADQAPSPPAQEDFFDAVRRDPDLTEDRRRRWLDLEPPKE